MKPGHLIYLFTLTVILSACNSWNHNRNLSDEDIFIDYVIEGQEDRKEVTCRFQFQGNGPRSEGIALQQPARVQLDSLQLQPDSARHTGVYYEAIKPIGDFIGRHSIIFTDRNEKQYKEE